MPSTRLAVLYLALATTACTPASDTTADTSETSAAVSPAPAPVPAERTDTSSARWVLTDRSLGPLQVGMTIEEASKAVNTTLTSRDNIPGSTCQYMRWPNGPDGVLLMALDNRIARIEVADPPIETAEGVGIGATADRVKEMYAGRVVETPHKYTNGTYLTVRPAAASDSLYRLVFETDSGRVTRFRGGAMPAVEWVEGCS